MSSSIRAVEPKSGSMTTYLELVNNADEKTEDDEAILL